MCAGITAIIIAVGMSSRDFPFLSDGLVKRPRNWLAIVNHEQQENELDAIRNSVNRGSPFGDNKWIKRIAARLNLGSTINQRGRPHKKEEKEQPLLFLNL